MRSKGILDIEFILSVFVFVSTVSFVVIMAVISNIPLLQQLSVTEDLRSRNYQISEKILFTEGSPSNWDSNTVTSIGLSTGQMYALDLNKINNLSILCTNNYNRVKNLLGLDYENEMILNISYIDGSQILSCRPNFLSKRIESRIDRIGVIDGAPARMSVSVL
jgi:hypothetical protein